MQITDFPNTVSATLNIEDSKCFSKFAIVPNIMNGTSVLRVQFQNNPDKVYLFNFDSPASAEELYDMISDEEIESYGSLFWSWKDMGKLVAIPADRF
jgi:hypothetical protein